MPINVALLKYGYSNFSLTILEFCDIESLTTREKYYFDKFSPEYNILKTPGSPSQGSGRIFSKDHKEKIRIGSAKRSQAPKWVANQSLSQSKGILLEVTDLKTNKILTYHAIRAAARDLGLDKRYIENYINLKQENPVLGRYIFKLSSSTLQPLEKINQKSLKIEVTDVNSNETTLFPSIGGAARALSVRQSSISVYLKKNRSKPFKGKYLIKLINF